MAELKNPFRNGTTHMLFSPLDFLSKLSALVPRPRHHLVRNHGIFAPNARMRKLIVPTKCNKTKTKTNQRKHKLVAEPQAADELIAPLTWAQRLKKVFNIDITLCPLCGGTLHVIGRGRLRITNPDAIQKILHHMRGPPRARPPPLESATVIQS